jgi:hypothetical protein
MQDTPIDAELLEARLAARVAGLLATAADDPPPGVAERLRHARALALARRPVAVGAAPPARSAAGWRAALARVAARVQAGLWPGVGAALPVAVLALGAWVIAEQTVREHAAVAATVDVALLTDDLPPEAYIDPGFVAFLKLQEP